MNKQIASTLKKAGIPPHILGYDYLGEAIELVLEDRNQLRLITKSLYPSIAKKFKTAPSRVERAIRHAIETSFINLGADEIEELFGNTFSAYTGRPTNSHFIAAMVELHRYINE